MPAMRPSLRISIQAHPYIRPDARTVENKLATSQAEVGAVRMPSRMVSRSNVMIDTVGRVVEDAAKSVILHPDVAAIGVTASRQSG